MSLKQLGASMEWSELAWGLHHWAGYFSIHPASTTNHIESLLHKQLHQNGQPSHIFFDIDETLVMRNTSFVYGFHSTDVLVQELKTLVSKADYSLIKREMEKQYLDASVSMVDDGLVILIRKLIERGHKVFALTSNAPDSPFLPKSLEALERAGVSFSHSSFQGEMNETGATVKNHESIGGVIHCSYGEEDDKGAIMSEFMSQTEDGEQFAEFRHCMLIDNTLSKCEKALHFFNAHSTCLFEAIHYTLAEESISASQMEVQLLEILEKQQIQIEPEQLHPTPDGFMSLPVCA
eukprot:CAMPEP_0113934994 /NCGR_PEP_ID=MMETSP1339-20121228/2235_1 /TAXON_ID=94617 /ORGANISM="Fibrocapsa japonica" /LENGTH=291 /DNA_ID=CAMNT_0000937005 /DNA_START=120 /DNA_END=995 /DNA_ORIENTATION=- /assembly_acc=CAM_ASM_000762